jgi:hypothetical protein
VISIRVSIDVLGEAGRCSGWGDFLPSVFAGFGRVRVDSVAWEVIASNSFCVLAFSAYLAACVSLIRAPVESPGRVDDLREFMCCPRVSLKSM